MWDKSWHHFSTVMRPAQSGAHMLCVCAYCAEMCRCQLLLALDRSCVCVVQFALAALASRSNSSWKKVRLFHFDLTMLPSQRGQARDEGRCFRRVCCSPGCVSGTAQQASPQMLTREFQVRLLRPQKKATYSGYFSRT